ncbi:MAG: hypothetical protein K2N06_04660 [Oscillospiraceae bacterium]|nr:hypothetical protein [Oscillospiraceae bacterium]
MPTNEKKGVTVKIDAELHAEVRQYLEEHEMTMGEFVSLALQNELHPKMNMEVKNVGNMRTMAFQVPEELFWKIKDYLQRNNMTQKQFVIGLIENEIERDLTQRAAESEQHETAAVSDCESVSEEQDNADFSDDFDGESEESENPDNDEDLDESEEQDESESMGMSMGM